MRSLWIIAVLMWFGCVVGCMTVPDDPEWREVNAGIRNLPPATLVNAKRWAANRNAANFMARIARKTKAFTVRCEQNALEEPAGDQDALSYDILVEDLLSCLDGSIADVTIAECATRLFKDRESAFFLNTGLMPDCWIVWAPWIYGMLDLGEGDKIETKVEEWDPDKVQVDDVERDLVEAPVLPRWVPFAVIGGVVVVGGLLTGGVGWLPALCTLQAGSGPACPSNPDYAVGSTPQPDRGGT